MENQMPNVVGKTKDEAIELLNAVGTRFRIVREDKQSWSVTCDYVTQRLNLEIDAGIVTAQAKG